MTDSDHVAIDAAPPLVQSVSSSSSFTEIPITVAGALAVAAQAQAQRSRPAQLEQVNNNAGVHQPDNSAKSFANIESTIELYDGIPTQMSPATLAQFEDGGHSFEDNHSTSALDNPGSSLHWTEETQIYNDGSMVTDSDQFAPNGPDQHKHLQSFSSHSQNGIKEQSPSAMEFDLITPSVEISPALSSTSPHPIKQETSRLHVELLRTQSVMSAASSHSSVPSIGRASSHAVSNAPGGEIRHLPARAVTDTSSMASREDYRPKISIPSTLAPEDYARQCIVAAYSSRLNPFGLHAEEHLMLRDHINHAQVTIYLNIRNGILRLWMRNPLVAVTKQEAAGCAKDYRWFDVADVCHEWLVRRGYINFGCVEGSDATAGPEKYSVNSPVTRRKSIVIIGAGMAGLGCARQLEALFAHSRNHWHKRGEEIPQVVVLEGRGRIGGRIYSHPLKAQASDTLPTGLRCTADLGAQIITGFDHGNPLSPIIRGQLGLRYHLLKDNSILYDSDGTAVDKSRDQRVEKLYNDILERASIYRHKTPTKPSIDGDRELIESGLEPSTEIGKTITALENAAATLPEPGSGALSTRTGGEDEDLMELDKVQEAVASAVDKLTGKSHISATPSVQALPVQAAADMGWQRKSGTASSSSLHLEAIAKGRKNPTLGSIMDEAVRQYESIMQLTPQDLRLLNWHYANLEYANAVNVDDLSLASWDQDIGNEFEGEHATIVGGYLQVPRGLSQLPTRLDIRTHRIATKVTYSEDPETDQGAASVLCSNGEVIEADKVVVTLPLGVLKSETVTFEPSLPDWKRGSIKRLGFGTLNKVVLVYEKPFWDIERDMFGLLHDPVKEGSTNQRDFVQNRGRFYLFWNCIKTSGQPMLVAIMAGDAAHQTQIASEADLVQEATRLLSKIFPTATVPEPLETIVSRWGKDPFTHGSYSYMAPPAKPDDYEQMAKPVGNLHFAGEATCGSHPATVHGAYLSGLRAASEILESLIGPIKVPTPLVSSKSHYGDVPMLAGTKRKTLHDSLPQPGSPAHDATSAAERLQALQDARLTAFEADVAQALADKLGPRPEKPGKSGANPFLLYQKDMWHKCKDACDASARASQMDQEAKASRNEVRAALGAMWRNAPPEEKAPYLEQTANNKMNNSAEADAFRENLARWDREARELRDAWARDHPSEPGEEEVALMKELRRGEVGGGGRRAKRVNGTGSGSGVVEGGAGKEEEGNG